MDSWGPTAREEYHDEYDDRLSVGHFRPCGSGRIRSVRDDDQAKKLIGYLPNSPST